MLSLCFALVLFDTQPTALGVLEKEPTLEWDYKHNFVEGKNVSGGNMTEMFVQLKLGDQRYKSKTLCKSANPQWQERFDFHYFSDRMGILEIEVWGKDSKKHEERLGT
uniref:Multiple C2 and transmembrane domain-containing protein 2-like n=1 Tax=Castor canadensis TaxID=51338 RepID=A0A8B7UWT9_CASCN|nr:multiple C2 and transmembrane domain-containing protein 2-like [Castor canadensis]